MSAKSKFVASSFVATGIVSIVALASPVAGCSSSSDGAAGMNMDGGMDMDGMGGNGAAPSSTPIAEITGDAVYVVNGGDNSISVIDPGPNKVIGTIMLKNAMYPHHIYLSHDKSMLALAVPGMDMSGGHQGAMDGMHGAVMVLDAKTGATMTSTMLDQVNHNAIFSADDTEIWTTQMMMGGKVLVLDAMKLTTKATIDVGDMPAEVTFSPDNKLAFVANGMSNNVSVIDVATKKVLKTVSVGNDPVVPNPGTDGKMYVDCEEGKQVAVVDPASQTVTLTYNLGFTPGMARTTPAGTELWVTDGDNGKVVFDMVGQDKKMGEAATGAGAHGIAFSADGRTGYVTNQGAGTVSVIDVSTHKVTATIQVGAKPNGLAFRSK